MSPRLWPREPALVRTTPKSVSKGFMTPDMLVVVDYAVRCACAHAGAAEDVGGGGGAEEGFG